MKNFGLSDSLGAVRETSDLCPECGQSATIDHQLCVNCLLARALGPDETSAESDPSFEQFLTEIDVPDREWRLGNYEILEEIARGGMGVVYRARQRHSRRIVALKRILSYHSDSRETLERFRREAEAAASLDHPNILPIYEVSESDGLPFFSMKYAAGGSLRDAAGAAVRSNPRECVALLAKVSRATEYAHSQGILHRDLKPGNILLDSRGEPFVSDFGLAKWLDTSTDLTRTLTVFGTPGYIAPEQAEGASVNLTPAADVYSLGAVLFDLLTSRPPFLGEHALAVIKQAAEKPAPKLRSLVPTADRDLETICARCLEREPAARYQSAADLANDLECWLQGKPIKARRALPPKRIWRWSRRNPVLVKTAAACLLLGAASVWFLWQQGLLQQISALTKKVLSPREATEQVKLRQALLEYPDAEIEIFYLGSRGSQSAELEHICSRLAQRVGLDQKLLQNKLPTFVQTVKRDRDAPLHERACAQYFAKDFAESERLSLKAADEAQKAGLPRANDVIAALKLAAFSAGRSQEIARVREHLKEAEKLTDQQRNPRQWADVQYAIATTLLRSSEQPNDVERIVRHVIEVRTHIFGPEHRETLSARCLLAMSLLYQAKYAEMEQEYRELIKLYEKTFGPEDPDTLWRHYDLSLALSGNYGYYSDLQASLSEMRHVLKLREKTLGPEHPDTLRAREGVSNTLGSLGQFKDAIVQKRDLLALERKVLGAEDKLTVRTLENLGWMLADNGEFRDGEAMLREALRLCEKVFGAERTTTLECRTLLARTLAAQTKGLEAEAEAREIVKVNDKAFGPDRSGWTRDLVGVILDKQGRYPEAETQMREALRMLGKTPSDEDTETDTFKFRGHLAKTLWYQGKDAEAEIIIRELIARNEKVLGTHAYDLGRNMQGRLEEQTLELTPLTSRTLLANTLRDQGKYAEAEAEYKNVIPIEEKVLGPENFDTLNACYNYAYQLAQQGKRNEAKPLAERAAKTAAKVLPANDPDTREYEKFLEILEKGQPIPTPYMKFHEIFWLGKET